MDASISIKSPPPAGKSLAVRDPVTAREAVATDLDHAKAVTPAGDGGAKHHDQHQRHADQRGQHADHAPQDLIADPASREVIYRERDVRAEGGAHPDQALLRQRAYRPASAAESSSSVAHDPHADIKA